MIRTTHQRPINKELWDLLEKQRGCFWLAKHPDLSADLKDIKFMPKEWANFAKFLSAFFAVSDSLVNVSLEDRLKYFIEKYASKYEMEIKYLWHFQMMMEDTHSEQYSLLVETYCIDPEEKSYYINCIENFVTIKDKANFILSINEEKYDNNPLYILTACACIERIGFSASFAGVYWFKSKNLMHGFAEANDYIVRDEGLHCDTATTIFNLLVRDDPTLITPDVITEIKNIVRNACDIEKRFAEEALPHNLPGMNALLMGQYVECIGDHLLQAINIEPIYNSSNPFDFMDMIGLQTKTSFFEKKVTEYQKSSEDSKFDMVDDI